MQSPTLLGHHLPDQPLCERCSDSVCATSSRGSLCQQDKGNSLIRQSLTRRKLGKGLPTPCMCIHDRLDNSRTSQFLQENSYQVSRSVFAMSWERQLFKSLLELKCIELHTSETKCQAHTLEHCF